MQTPTGILLLAWLTCATASYCVDSLHGRCVDLMHISCTSGQKYAMNYCDMFQLCCYDPQTQAATTTPPTGQPARGVTEVGYTSTNATRAARVVGGTVAQRGELPWQVSVRTNSTHVCCGTLIGDRWVLTVANCFDGHRPIALGAWTVLSGVANVRNAIQSDITNVESIYEHAGYNLTDHSNDIALIKLAKPLNIQYRYRRTTCLPEASDTFDADICTVAGWGSDHYIDHGSQISRQLKYVNLQTMTNAECRYFLDSLPGFHLQPSNICAGITTDGGKDTCSGDAGGALVCRKRGVWEVAGIVSSGYNCGKAHMPGVYTRVTSYLDWIKTHTGI